MKEASSPYVIDACALFNLEKIVPLWAFPPPGGLIRITRLIAEEEIKRWGRFKYINWLQSGKLEDLKAGEEKTFFKLLSPQQRPRIHSGEASAIAIAIHRGWIFVSDDESAKKKARDHNIEVLGSQDFYKELSV